MGEPEPPSGRMTITPSPSSCGERQQLPLGLALARVERDLDRVDPPGAHDARELVERAGRVVRRAEEADAAGVLLPLEPVEVLAPGDQVVHLLQVDAAPEEAELVGELGAALLDGAGPDLRRHEGLFPPPGQRAAEHALGAAVHRRGVDELRSGGEGGVDDGVRGLLLGVRQVERRPGPEADDGELDAGAPEGSPLHTVCRHAPGEPTRRSRARRGPHRRPGLRRELPGRLAARAALRPPAPAAIYGFARLVDTLGDEAAGDREALLDELERELEGEPRTEIMRRLHATIAELRPPA